MTSSFIGKFVPNSVPPPSGAKPFTGKFVKNGSLPVPQYQAPLGGGKFALTPQQKALNSMRGLL